MEELQDQAALPGLADESEDFEDPSLLKAKVIETVARTGIALPFNSASAGRLLFCFMSGTVIW